MYFPATETLFYLHFIVFSFVKSSSNKFPKYFHRREVFQINSLRDPNAEINFSFKKNTRLNHDNNIRERLFTQSNLFNEIKAKTSKRNSFSICFHRKVSELNLYLRSMFDSGFFCSSKARLFYMKSVIPTTGAAVTITVCTKESLKENKLSCCYVLFR